MRRTKERLVQHERDVFDDAGDEHVGLEFLRLGDLRGFVHGLEQVAPLEQKIHSIQLLDLDLELAIALAFEPVADRFQKAQVAHDDSDDER